MFIYHVNMHTYVTSMYIPNYIHTTYLCTYIHTYLHTYLHADIHVSSCVFVQILSYSHKHFEVPATVVL